MSEQLQAVLLDSNAYFRLAQSIHPLLKGSFGEAPRYTLFVLDVLDNEYKTSSRLQHKFEWVADSEHVKDRAAKHYKVHRKTATFVDNALKFLIAYADEHKFNVSLEDLKALAVGFVDSIPVVTDDINMTKLGEAHHIECWNTVKLLKVMYSSGQIDDDKVTEILEYWEYERDLPMSLERLREIFKTYFSKECPI